MLLSSPLVWLQYYLLLLPLSLYVIYHGAGDSSVAIAGHTPARNSFARLLPYLPLVIFSLLFHMFLGKNLKLMCIFVILATILTVVLAAYNFWHHRRALYLLPVST
jgi:hypothetical protein